jgi:hypothetical protein
VVVGLVNLDDIHEASRVVHVSSDLAVNLDNALGDNELGLLAGQSILQSVPEEDNQRKTLTELVGTRGRVRSLSRMHVSKRKATGEKEKRN